MAKTQRTLILGMKVDHRPLKRGMDKSKKSVVSFRATVEKTSQRVGAAFMKIAVAAVAMGASFAALRKPLKLAADFETTATSFRVLLGDAKEAKRVMEDLTNFAASTPFQFPELATAERNLIAFGVATQDLLPTMKNLGNIAAGLNIPFGELSEIYGKAKVSGRLFMEDINQLAGRGIPIQEELAKQFGVTADKVRELVSGGQVNFGHLEKAFQSLAGEGGKFFGLMAAQSETLNGLWSTQMDNMNLLLQDFGTKVAEVFNLKQVVKNNIDFLQSMRDRMNAFFERNKQTMKDWLAVGQQAFNVMKAQVVLWYNVFGGRVRGVGEMFSNFTSLVSNNAKSIVAFLLYAEFGFTRFWDIVKLKQTEGMLTLTRAKNYFESIFTRWIPQYVLYAYQQVTKIMTGIQKNILGIALNITNNASRFNREFPNLLSGKTTIADIWEPITEGMDLTLDELPKMLPRKIDAFERMFAKEAKRLKTNLMDDFFTFSSKRMNELFPIPDSKLFDVLKGKFKDTFQDITGFIGTAWGKMNEGFQAMEAFAGKRVKGWEIVGDAKDFRSSEAANTILRWRQLSQGQGKKPETQEELARRQLRTQEQIKDGIQEVVEKLVPYTPYILPF